MPLSFTVLGVPQPQGSIRPLPSPYMMGQLKRSRGRGVTIYSVADLMKCTVLTSDNPQLKSWRSRVAFEATLALRGMNMVLGGPVDLFAVFRLPRVTRIPKRSTPAHLSTPDEDKLLRAIKDALTGVLYLDDKLVVHSDCWKRYCAVGEEPGAEIRITPLSWPPDPSSPIFPKDV